MGAYIFLQGSFSSKKRVGAFCNHQHTKREKEKTEESPALFVLDRFIANSRIFILSLPPRKFLFSLVRVRVQKNKKTYYFAGMRMTLDAYAAPTIVLIFNTVFNVMFILLLLVFVACDATKKN